MNILYVGDVYAEPGMRVLGDVLPELRKQRAIDFVVAQAENVTEGRGITPADMTRLQAAGVDFCTGGNWSLHHPEIIPLLDDPSAPIVRPANYPAGTPGKGWKIARTPKGNVLVVSLLGDVVGRDASKPTDNPLRVIDAILSEAAPQKPVATIVNFHGDYSSQKVIIGHYLDGRVTVVVGDHWHIPTADARVLPGGTAHMSDVGMCGVLNASLGVKLDAVIPRWRDNIRTRNEVELTGPRQFNALLVTSNDTTGLATMAEPINLVLD